MKGRINGYAVCLWTLFLFFLVGLTIFKGAVVEANECVAFDLNQIRLRIIRTVRWTKVLRERFVVRVIKRGFHRRDERVVITDVCGVFTQDVIVAGNEKPSFDSAQSQQVGEFGARFF